MFSVQRRVLVFLNDRAYLPQKYLKQGCPCCRCRLRETHAKVKVEFLKTGEISHE